MPTGCLQEGTAYSFWSDHMPAGLGRGLDGVDPRGAAAPARARHHGLAGRVGPTRSVEGVSRARRPARAVDARGDRAVVGPTPRARADRRADRAVQLGERRQGQRADDQDHAGWLSRERHRLDARALRGSLRRGTRSGTAVRRGRGARRGRRAARRRRVPDPPARAGGPGVPCGARRRRGGARGQRLERPPPSHRPPAVARPRRHPSDAAAGRRGQHPAGVGLSGPDDRDAHAPAGRRARRPPLPDRRRRAQRRGRGDGQRLAGDDARTSSRRCRWP